MATMERFLSRGSDTFDLVTTSTYVYVNTTASTILGVNSARNYAIIKNLSNTQVLLNFGSPPTTSSFGLTLEQFGAYEIVPNQNLWVGNIQAITSTLTSTLTITEW